MNVTIRHAVAADLGALVHVHQSAFPGFFLTDLGSGFLKRLYRGFLTQQDGIVLVAVGPGNRITGLLAGTAEPETFFPSLRRRAGMGIALAAVPALLQHPLRVAERLFSALRYRGDRPVALRGYWLLSSLGVAREHTGSGVGSALVSSFCRRAEGGGASGVYLLTDQDDNDAARRFYEKQGFKTQETQHRRNGRGLLIMAWSSKNE
jgi:ribosomal protein S18 acetylase RimI-like enzyme